MASNVVTLEKIENHQLGLKKGFQENHFGLRVNKPDVSGFKDGELATLKDNNNNEKEAKWTHFSVWVNQKRRLPAVVAYNTFAFKHNRLREKVFVGEGRLSRSNEEDENFEKEDQLPRKGYYTERDAQGNSINVFDYGHQASRDVLAWGNPAFNEPNHGSRYSCVYTNICPQRYAGFHRDQWRGLENWICEGLGIPEANREDITPVSAFVGPLWNWDHFGIRNPAGDTRFHIGNQNYQKMFVPAGFFHVVFVKTKQGIEKKAYILKHDDIDEGMSEPEQFAQLLDMKNNSTEVKVEDVEELTGLKFSVDGGMPPPPSSPPLSNIFLEYGLVNPKGPNETQNEKVVLRCQGTPPPSLQLRFFYKEGSRNYRKTTLENPQKVGEEWWVFSTNNLQLSNSGGALEYIYKGRL